MIALVVIAATRATARSARMEIQEMMVLNDSGPYSLKDSSLVSASWRNYDLLRMRMDARETQ